MAGDAELQGYVAKRYNELHQQGYSKSEAHSIAFQELRMLQAQQQAQRAQMQAQANANDPFYEFLYG
jgi:multidrug resistance efflux pump